MKFSFKYLFVTSVKSSHKNSQSKTENAKKNKYPNKTMLLLEMDYSILESTCTLQILINFHASLVLLARAREFALSSLIFYIFSLKIHRSLPSIINQVGHDSLYFCIHSLKSFLVLYICHPLSKRRRTSVSWYQAMKTSDSCFLSSCFIIISDTLFLINW